MTSNKATGHLSPSQENTRLLRVNVKAHQLVMAVSAAKGITAAEAFDLLLLLRK